MNKKLISECTDYDFKVSLEESRPKSWLKTVSAFANGLGGSLFFGVDDSGEVAGLQDIKTTGEKITEFISARISPMPMFDMIPQEAEDKQFLEIAVYAGTTTPYYYDFDGVKEAYIRMGNQTVIAPNHILNELILKGENKTFDEIVTKYRKADYSFSFFEASYYDKTRTRIIESDYPSFGLTDEKGNLTNAGALLADQNIYFFNRVFCTRWNGLDKTSVQDDATDDAEFDGSILKLLDSAMDFVKRNTKKKWRKENRARIEMPEYDELAVREALVNALIHRAYTVKGAEVSVNIYNNRMEIVSPGSMMSGERVNGAVEKSIPSVRRNPVLADIFARMHLMERRGSGLKKIVGRTNALFDDDGNHVEFFSDNTFFTVVIYNANYGKNDDFGEDIESFADKDGTVNDTVNGTVKNIFELIATEPKITVEELISATNKSRRTIMRAIHALKEKGYIERVGSDKSGYWKILREM